MVSQFNKLPIMPNTFFQFKQFLVSHSKCAMKVGTDGVLIGAWAEGGDRILDIGTGTGLIALMMAQRFPQSSIKGIDIDKSAVEQARENVDASPFAERISISLENVCTYPTDNLSPSELFDCIVSNPPFFENSLECPNNQRSMARHTSQLSFDILMSKSAKLLTDKGILSIIVPTHSVSRLTGLASIYGLYLCRQCDIKTIERKDPKRTMLAFSHKRPYEISKTTVCLMENEERSQWYKELTTDFYL